MPLRPKYKYGIIYFTAEPPAHAMDTTKSHNINEILWTQ